MAFVIVSKREGGTEASSKISNKNRTYFYYSLCLLILNESQDGSYLYQVMDEKFFVFPHSNTKPL